MGWGIGFDDKWNRYIGYSVPAYCDHPGCEKEIDRGLAYVCGGEPYGGDRGCGLFFCGEHLYVTKHGQLCERCSDKKKPFNPKPEHPDWIKHILTDKSWAKWRRDNKASVQEFKRHITPREEG